MHSNRIGTSALRIFTGIILQAAICLQVGAQTKVLAQSGASELQRQYDAAQKYQLSGHLDEAAEHYRAFLAGALDELAEARTGAGDFARGNALFEEALALTPEDASLRLDYARAALAEGDLSRAESASHDAIDNHPGTQQQVAEAHQILGRALLKANKDQEARSELEKAVALDANFKNGYALAVVCLDLDDEKCAGQVFREMETSFGDTAKVHLTFGRAYGNSDFAPQAVEEFKKAIEKDPRLPGAHYCLAAALLSLGDDAKNIPIAEEELKKELTLSPRDSLSNAALGKLAVGEQKYALAETYLKKATTLDPRNPDGFLYLGQMYFDQQRFDDAETNLRRAIQLTTDVSRNRYQVQKAHYLLGRVFARQHKADEAHAEMEIARAFADKGLSHDKNELAGLLSNKAATSDGIGSNDATSGAVVTGNDDPAARDRVSALEKKLGLAIADTYDNLGAIAATGGNYAVAVGLFEHAYTWNPALDGLDLNWGRAAFMASKFKEALAPPLACC